MHILTLKSRNSYEDGGLLNQVVPEDVIGICLNNDHAERIDKCHVKEYCLGAQLHLYAKLELELAKHP